jgi:hypothetical protein
MVKLLGGLGLCVAMTAAMPGMAQDPFTPQIQESSRAEAAALFVQAPRGQSEPDGPIIQTMPTGKSKPIYDLGPRTSRAENAHVRTTRTPSEEAVYQRAVYLARQRTLRIEQRKWLGESLLRPDTPPKHNDILTYSVPVWYWSNLR